MKKIIVMSLIILTLLMTFNNIYAIQASSDDIEETVKALNIMSGYTDGSMHLDNNLTRAQFSKIIINASKYKNSVSSKSTISPFKDVPYSNWAAPYINVAVSNGLINGYPNASFKPDKNVTLEEAVTVVLAVMGYGSDDFGASWPYGQINTAADLGLLKNCSAQTGQEISRRDAMNIVYNMLNSKLKDGSLYIDTLGYKLLEDVILISLSEEDSSIKDGEILTSSGTYKILDNFNKDNMGKEGNIITNSNDEIISFISSNNQVTTYTVYAVLEDDIIAVTSNGNNMFLELDENTVVYYKGEKATISNMISKVKIGDIVKVSRSEGVIDYAMVLENNLNGPIIAADYNFVSKFNIDDSNIKIMRNGSQITLDDINVNDVLYYSKSLNTLWDYNKKITGIYESAYPNKDQPSSVFISGIEYSIETAEAFNKLSSDGSFETGDYVTLLLGRDDRIADVISPSLTSIVGYLINSGNEEVTNSSGYKYNMNYIEIVDTEGNKYQYEVSKDYINLLNSIVTVEFDNGYATVKRIKKSNIYGIFDWKNKKLGSDKIADDIKIMDIGTVDSDDSNKYIITYPQRIDNVKIDSDNILYYSKNSKGEINNLILKNVTGDTFEYGLVKKANVIDDEDNLSSTYICDINGNEYKLIKNNSAYTNITSGQPAAFDINNNSIESIKSLLSVKEDITYVNAIQLKTDKDEVFLLSENVVIYEYTNSGGYRIIPLSEIIDNNNINVEAYYDKSELNGGRIRVIIFYSIQ
jgi:hypothetical protein